MSLRVVGAGLGRTATHSQKVALERLLGAPCHHMVEVFKFPEQIPHWLAAAQGNMPDWQAMFSGYAAAVDWPTAAYWKEISEAFPEAKVLLSVRDPESWWKSASSTIFRSTTGMPDGPFKTMAETMMANRFTSALHDRDACIAAFERHYAEVRATVPASRLIEWRASDGWGPLCEALGVPVPEEPFPLTNTTEEFLKNHAGPPPH